MKNKTAKYERIYNQIKKLCTPINNPYSRMATIIAILHNKIDYFFWTGFYNLDETGELLVCSYQGPLACLRLAKGKGVCWASINQEESLIIQDVEQFPGHIACNSKTKSEIVIPVKDNYDKIVGVLDVDSTDHNSFDNYDKEWLEKIVKLIYQ